ncbi:MAG TPA: hypothetical protein VFO76_13260 [Candidatus Kapabacteria bacterium]|nr:hypothetical protein [Candidatus Kapabacteria bacterium]
MFTGLRVSYGQSDSCLKVLSSATDTTWSNPDSVKADSCIGSSTYGQLYCKGWFIVEFSYYVLPAPWGPADTIIDRTWHDIDTVYPTIRNYFDTLEQKYGTFFFRKQQPDFVDTSLGRSSIFKIWFSNNVNIDSVKQALKSAPFVRFADYDMRIIVYAETRIYDPSKFLSLNKIVLSRSLIANSSALLKSFIKAENNDINIFDLLGNRIESYKTQASEETIIHDLFSFSNGMFMVQNGSSIILINVCD